MNCVVSLIQILLAAVLHISTVKTASINKEVKSKNEGYKGQTFRLSSLLVPFLDVYNKSMCQTREMLVDIYHEYPEEIEHTYIPSCVVLKRCSGCCNDEALECVPSETRNVTMEVLRVRQKHSQHTIQLSFTEHLKCDCRQKPEVKAKKEKGKGQKRKRKKQRDTIRIAEAEAYTSTAVRVSTVSLLVVGLISVELFWYFVN